MSYKPNYNEEYISSLAEYVTSDNKNSQFNSITAPASSVLEDTGAMNVFTGTLQHGSNLTQQYYQRYGETRDFEEAFKSVIDMYEKQAELTRHNVESIIQKGWEQDRINNEIALQQAQGTLAEQGTLGTGQRAISKSHLENIAKRQTLDIDMAASQALFEAWSAVDLEATKLIQMTSDEYTKFIATANSIEIEMWKKFLETFGENYAGILTEEVNGEIKQLFDYETDWWDALVKIGIIDEETEGYTSYGKAMINYIIGNSEDIIGFNEFINNSEYKDFYLSNSKFIREHIFELEDFDFSTYYSDRDTIYKESEYRLGHPLEDLSPDARKTEELKYTQKAMDITGAEEIFQEQNFWGKWKTKATARTYNELNLDASIRAAITSGDITEGSVLRLNTGKKNKEESWVYVGDGVFVKTAGTASAGDETFGFGLGTADSTTRNSKKLAGTKAEYEAKDKNMSADEYAISKMTEYGMTYKYLYKDKKGNYVYSQIRRGDIGYEKDGYVRIK